MDLPTGEEMHTVGQGDDQVIVVRSDEKSPTKMTFDRVDFLSNGWVRGVVPADRSDAPNGQHEIDYLSPASVSDIWTIESDRYGI